MTNQDYDTKNQNENHKINKIEEEARRILEKAEPSIMLSIALQFCTPSYKPYSYYQGNYSFS